MKMPALLLLALTAAATLFAETAKVETLALGAGAPDFKLAGVDGKDWSLADFAEAKALVVVFTCNHCPTAQAYEERLKKITEDYKAKGVAVVAISPNDPKSVRLDELGYSELGDSFEDMKVRAKAAGFNFPYLYDGDTAAASRAYGPTVTPHTFVFDAARKLRYIGRIDDSERASLVKTQDLRAALDAILSGRAPEPAQTPAFGCSVKWAGKAGQVAAYMEKLGKEPVTVDLADAAALAALRKGEGNKVRLVNFWATWCGPCVAEFPRLVEINRMYRGRDFEFVSVSANFPDEKAEVLKFLTKQQASNRNLIFGTTDKYALIAAFDKTWTGAVPYTVLLSAKGDVLYKHEGEIEPIELKREILKALGREMKK